MHVKCSILLSINANWNVSMAFSKTSNIKFHNNHSAVLELLHMNRHGKANRHITATSLCKYVNRTGLPNHNKHDAVSILKSGTYLMFHNRC